MPETSIIAKALIVNDKQEILCVTRSLQDNNRPGECDLPGGQAEPDEEPGVCVRREVLQEVGLEPDDFNLVYTKTMVRKWGVGHWLIYLARVEGRPEVVLSDEHSGYQWLTTDEFRAASTYEFHHEVLGFVAANRLLDQSAD